MVADVRVIQPESPAKGWGVVQRARTLKDFTFVIIFSLIPVSIILFIVFPSLFGVNKETNLDLPFILVLLGFSVIPLLVAMGDPGGAEKEADAKARAKSRDWEENVLTPFLEAKYGIKFAQKLDLGHTWGWPRAYKDGRTIEVRPHGIESVRASFNPSFDYATEGYQDFVIGDEIWLEEVIRPEKVSYRKLDEVV